MPASVVRAQEPAEDEEVEFTPEEADAEAAVPAPAPAPSAEEAAETVAAEPAADPDASSMMVYVYPDPKLGGGGREAIEHGVWQAFARDRRIELRSFDDTLRDDEAETAELAKADVAVGKAGEQIRNLEVAEALDAMKAAEATYARLLTVVIARDGNIERLFEANRQLAIAAFLEKDAELAARTLRRLYILKPELDAKGLFPPQLQKIVTMQRLELETEEKGGLDITTNPPGAALLLDGRELGNAPQSASELTPGPHYVTATISGRPPHTRTVDVAPNETVAIDLTIPAYPDDPAAMLDAARKDLGKEPMSAGIAKAVKRLGDPELLVLIVPKVAGGTLALDGYLYDTRTNRLLKHSVGESDVTYPAPTAEALAGSLVENVRLDGTADTKLVVTGPSEGRLTRFRRSKWFWPVVGGAAGAVLLGIVIGVAASSNDGVRNQLVVLPALGTTF